MSARVCVCLGWGVSKKKKINAYKFLLLKEICKRKERGMVEERFGPGPSLLPTNFCVEGAGPGGPPLEGVEASHYHVYGV